MMNPGILRSQIPGLGYTGILQGPGYYITITFWWWPGSSWWFPPSLLSSLVASFCLGGWWWTGSVKYWRWGSWRWCCWWWWRCSELLLLIFIDVDNDLHNHGELVFLILLLILWKKRHLPFHSSWVALKLGRNPSPAKLPSPLFPIPIHNQYHRYYYCRIALTKLNPCWDLN